MDIFNSIYHFCVWSKNNHDFKIGHLLDTFLPNKAYAHKRTIQSSLLFKIVDMSFWLRRRIIQNRYPIIFLFKKTGYRKVESSYEIRLFLSSIFEIA